MIQSFSVPPIWVPTDFLTFDAARTGACSLAGCENARISDRAREAICGPEPSMLRAHWFSQDEGLRRELSRRHGISPSQIFLTSGAMAAIRYAFEVFVGAGTQVGLLRPEWPGFRFFTDHARARANYLEKAVFPFRFEVEAMVNFVRQNRIEFMILSNPSAVTGLELSRSEIDDLLSACVDTQFVIDEADSIYPEKSAAALVLQHQNVLFLESFSKFYGLSGLRIGYLISPRNYTEDFDRTINPIELASVSILAARAALADEQYQRETQETVQKNLSALDRVLRQTAYEVVAESRCFATYLWAAEPTRDPYLSLHDRGIEIARGETFGLSRGGRVNLSDSDGIETLIGALIPLIAVANG